MIKQSKLQERFEKLTLEISKNLLDSITSPFPELTFSYNSMEGSTNLQIKISTDEVAAVKIIWNIKLAINRIFEDCDVLFHNTSDGEEILSEYNIFITDKVYFINATSYLIDQKILIINMSLQDR